MGPETGTLFYKLSLTLNPISHFYGRELAQLVEQLSLTARCLGVECVGTWVQILFIPGFKSCSCQTPFRNLFLIAVCASAFRGLTLP